MFDLTHFALSADYLDGAKFHMFKAADYDEAASYARRKGWAVAG